MKADIVLIPGAWTGAWGWNALENHLSSSDHAVHSLTLSGLDNDGDVSDIDLEKHVTDVITFLESNNLSSVVLVGHSYSGIIVGLASQRRPDLIKHLVFVEAFLPVAGKSLLETAELNVEEEINSIEKNNGRWPAPTRAELEEQSFLKDVDKDWLSKNLVGHPGKTVIEKVPENFPIIKTNSTYIGGNPPNQSEQHFHDLAFIQLEGGHWPMITKPEKLAESIKEIAATV